MARERHVGGAFPQGRDLASKGGSGIRKRALISGGGVWHSGLREHGLPQGLLPGVDLAQGVWTGLRQRGLINVP